MYLEKNIGFVQQIQVKATPVEYKYAIKYETKYETKLYFKPSMSLCQWILQ